jgi:predicted RNase H-like nuclease (RuvC/YqgF family)
MSDKNHIENIQSIIDELAATNSFSAGAMAQFTKMKDELDAAEHTIKYLRRNNTEKDEELKDAKDEVRAANEEISRMYALEQEWHKRNSELCDREQQITRLEMTAQNESQRVTDHQEMFKVVFRNAIIRREVMTDPTAGYSDNGCHYGGDPAMKHEVKEEQE